MVLTINDIRNISAKMSEALKIDYTNFNTSFLRRRLLYCFDKMLVHKASEIDAVLADKQKTDALLYHMLVAGTEMFRDPGFWRSLNKQLSSRKGTQIRIWLPELTNCYELYSLVIFLEANGYDAVITVNSTSQKVIDEVKSLQIPLATDELNRSNFERTEFNTNYSDYVEINEEKTQTTLRYGMLSKVTFKNRWFMNELPGKYDLIIMRNVLLAYNKPLHERAVGVLVGSLDSKGLLALGIKELPLLKTTMFSAIDATESIYGRMN